MNYENARPKIRTGDALFFSGGNWRSWYGIQIMLVRMFKPSKWSHVGTAYVDHNRVFILEAVGSGVRQYPLSKEIPFGWVRRPTKLKISNKALDWAFDKIGTSYPKKLKMFLNKAMGCHLDLEGTMDCSDYFSGILAEDGVQFNCACDPTSLCDEVTDHWGGLNLITNGETS